MTYFKILSIILGVWMVIGGFWVGLWPEPWKRMVLKVMTDIRPRWILWGNAVWTLLVLWTWGLFLSRPSMVAFVVTLVMTLTFLKVIGSIFFWKKYREFAFALTNEPLALRTLMFSTAAIGFALLTMGFFF